MTNGICDTCIHFADGDCPLLCNVREIEAAAKAAPQPITICSSFTPPSEESTPITPDEVV